MSFCLSFHLPLLRPTGAHWLDDPFGLVVGALAAGSIAGLDIGPADQVVFLLVAAWLAALAFGLGWPLPSAARRVDEAVD